MNTARHDYDQIIADWMARPDADPGERPDERMGFMRSGMEETLHEAGLNADELAREMAHFDAAAMRFLNGTRVFTAAMPAPPQAPSLPGLNEPLGFWRWLGVVWLALGWVAGAAGALMTLLIPPNNAGAIATTLLYGASAALALIVFAAGVPTLANIVRRYRGLGFVLFWLPMILFSYGVAVAPLTLLDTYIKSMGPDFLPLALPLAIVLFAVLTLPSLWFIFRRLLGRAKPLTEPGDDDKIHPVLAILVAGLCVLVFAIGARVMLGWGQGPALVVGIFMTGLIIRIFHDREISWLFMPVVALPLALLAADMPPSNLAALTILGLSLAIGFIALVLSLARLRRYTVLFTSLTTAALALILVMAPTGPSPALWLNDKLGHPMKPLADATMQRFAQAYETDRGHAVLAALDGYRSIAASAEIQHYTMKGRTISLTADFRNTGELGIRWMRVELVDREYRMGAYACDAPFAVHAFANTLWPGDVAQVRLDWQAPDDCTAGTLMDLSETVSTGYSDYGWRGELEIEVQLTEQVDAQQLFREEARAWLGL